MIGSHTFIKYLISSRVNAYVQFRRAENQSGLTHKSSVRKFLNAQKSNSYTLYHKENHQQLLKHIINIGMRNELFVG